MTLAAVAIDVVGNEAFSTTSVVVSETSLTGTALANATTSALQEAFAASSLDAVCQVVFAADDPGTRGTLVSALGSATASYVDDDSGLVEQTLGALVGPVATDPKSLTNETAREALDLVRGLADAARVAGLGQGVSSTSEPASFLEKPHSWIPEP